MKFSLLDYKNLPVQVKATFAFLICSLLQKGISVFITPIFTRILTAEEYGKFATFNSWYEIITAIVSLSLVGGVYTTAMVKFENDRNILASSSQGIILISCTTWFLIYTRFSDFWNSIFSLNNIQMFAMILMVFTSASFGLWSIEQRVTYRYKRLVLVTIIVSLAKPIVGIIFVINSSDKVTARILGLLFVEIICYAGIIIYQFARGKRFFSKRYWVYIVCYSLPLIPHSISQTVLNGSDRIMIQSLVGDREAGFYNLAYNIALLMIILNSSLSQTMAPWTYQKLKDKNEKDINNIAIISCIVIAIMNLLLIIMAPEIISIFAPKNYAGAIYVVPPVAMSAYLMYLYDWFARIEYYFEKTHYVLIASISGAISNLILNYLFIPKFGYIAAGYTSLVSYGVYAILHYYFMRKICKEKMGSQQIYDGKKLLLMTSIFLIIGLCLNITYKSLVIRYMVLLVSTSIIIFYRKSISKELLKLFNIQKEK